MLGKGVDMDVDGIGLLPGESDRESREILAHRHPSQPAVSPSG